jgi:hypothetical protein
MGATSGRVGDGTPQTEQARSFPQKRGTRARSERAVYFHVQTSL